jgi:DNA repair protein RadD
MTDLAPALVRSVVERTPDPVVWRPYQKRATNAAVTALKDGKAALEVMPTGSGKSWQVAEAARRAHAAEKRTLIIAPTRELVQQDADALLRVTGNALVPSLACAGLGRVELAGAVVIGTPQTVVRRLAQLGRVDLLIIDEAHRLGRKASGQICSIIAALRAHNPKLMLLGLTATPFRLDSGRLIEGDDRLFNEIAFEVSYSELVAEKYLAPLVGPRDAIEQLDVTGLRIVGGDYAPGDLAHFDRSEITARIVDQIIEHGAARKFWLVFGVSIGHAANLTDALMARGIDARLLTGGTPKTERKELVADFKAGRVRCLVGVDVFSVGFDAPAVDLIAIARPTCSPVWHVQSAGRGTRLAPGKTDCLILDFAGNFARLGPIDDPYVRQKGERARGSGDEPLTKNCPNCNAIIAARARRCPVCEVPLCEPQHLSASAADHNTITGADTITCDVRGVGYEIYRKPGRPAPGGNGIIGGYTPVIEQCQDFAGTREFELGLR